MTKRSEGLAASLEQGANALIAFASSLTDAEWHTRVPHDGRKVGVTVHHVATVYPIEIGLAQTIASGKPITGVVNADIDAMNAAHAKASDGVTRDETVALLRKNSAEAAAAIRAMSEKELDRAEKASLYSDAVITAQFVLEDHAVRHSYHHLSRLKKAVGK